MMELPKRKPSGKQAAAQCRRRADRRAYHTSVALSVLRGGEFSDPIIVQAVDISGSGIGVVARQMMHDGTVGALHLLMPNQDTTIVGVEVMNCQYVGDMKHRIGLRFTELHPLYVSSGNMPDHCRVVESKDAHFAFKGSVNGRK